MDSLSSSSAPGGGGCGAGRSRRVVYRAASAPSTLSRRPAAARARHASSKPAASPPAPPAPPAPVAAPSSPPKRDTHFQTKKYGTRVKSSNRRLFTVLRC